jgi:hypothetical protein
MRLLANDLGPAKIAFLCYPFPSREVTAVLDRFALRSDICGISNYSHSTLFQVQFVSRAMTLNNRTSDFLAERIRKNASTVCFAADPRSGTLRCEIGPLISWFCAKSQVRKNL